MYKPKKIALVIANYPIYEQFCPHFSGMQDGLKALGIEHKVFSVRPHFPEPQEIIDYKPDVVIYGLLDIVRAQNWRKVVRSGLPEAKIIMWYGDLRNPTTGQITANMSEIDLMFVSNDAQGDYYKRQWQVPECLFLPLAATWRDPEIDPKFSFDFVFIGGKITGSAFLDRAVEIFAFQKAGMKTIDADARTQSNLRAKVLKMMPTIYRSSKICLDQSHFTDILRYTSNRFWNITAGGGFALTKRFPGCEEFYPEGTRAYFDSFEDALKKRDYYLAHPKEREAIRKAGHEHAKNHTYEQRFLQMFSLIEKHVIQ